MGSLRIAACQLNLQVGDLRSNKSKKNTNKEKILNAYQKAEEAQADIAVFSELAVCGYPPEDLLLKSGFVADTQLVLNEIASETKECVAIIGFVEGKEAGADPVRRTSNAAAICVDGEIKGTYSKRALPDYGVFDEERYFASGTNPIELFEIRGVNVGITICEDIWVKKGIASELASAGAQIILNLNASPFEIGKLEARETVLCQRINETGIPIIYINQVGGQDELIFDGGSMAFDANKDVIARAELFKEQVLIFDIDCNESVKTASRKTIKISENSIEESLLKHEVDSVIVDLIMEHFNIQSFEGLKQNLSGEEFNEILEVAKDMYYMEMCIYLLNPSFAYKHANA